MSTVNDVTKFGAKADGIADDSSAIQAALNNCGQISIPVGVYKIGSTLRVSSNTRITAASRARIFLGDGAGINRNTFLLTNKPQAKHICIEGGIWDGNNLANPRSKGLFSKGYTGVLLNFVDVEDLTLKNITVRNPESFFIRVGELRKFIFDGIKFEAPSIRPNQDGIHLGGFCEDGEIYNVTSMDVSTPNDDVIALNADDAVTRVINQGMKCGPQRRITIKNVSVRDAHTIVRLLSIDSIIEDIDISDITAGFKMNFINADAARYCATPIFDEMDSKYIGGVGCLKNIFIKDINVYKSSVENRLPYFRMETRMKNFCVKNFIRNEAFDTPLASVPTIHIAKTPVKGLLVDGVSMDEIKAVSSDLEANNLNLDSKAGALSGDLTQNEHIEFYCKKFDRFMTADF